MNIYDKRKIWINIAFLLTIPIMFYLPRQVLTMIDFHSYNGIYIHTMVYVIGSLPYNISLIYMFYVLRKSQTLYLLMNITLGVFMFSLIAQYFLVIDNYLVYDSINILISFFIPIIYLAIIIFAFIQKERILIKVYVIIKWFSSILFNYLVFQLWVRVDLFGINYFESEIYLYSNKLWIISGIILFVIILVIFNQDRESRIYSRDYVSTNIATDTLVERNV